MKTTVVPAQVTTVEDKIAGNLGFTQLLLLTTPVFLDGALFTLFPPFFKLTALKLVIGFTLATICMMLAIRIRGKILLAWLAVISRYNVRPRHYIFNKNTLYLRDNEQQSKSQPVAQKVEVAKESETHSPLFIPMPEMVRLESAVADPRSRFHFKATKGGLRVYIHEVKKEGV